MRVKLAFAVVAAMLAISLVLPASAATKTVEVMDNFFDPKKTRVRVGAAVEWVKEQNTGQAHNVTDVAGLFSSGQPASTFTFKRTFSAGTFKYICEVHRFSGMNGTVKVPVVVNAGPAGLPFKVKWATAATNTGKKFDVHYKVGSGAWKKWKRGTTAKAATFGANNSPVRLVAGKAYSFRARSKVADGASAWSPIKTFKPFKP